jgi:hypothetical protein
MHSQIRLISKLDFNADSADVAFADLEQEPFHSKDSSADNSKSELSLRKIARRLLAGNPFILIEDSNYTFKSVHPWTFSIRGSYVNVPLNFKALESMWQRVLLEFYSNYSIPSNDRRSNIVLHYRLGDLVRLKGKSPIDSSKLTALLNSEFDTGEVSVISDSPSLAVEKLHAVNPNLNLQFLDIGTWESLRNMVEADTFIGTPSKLTMWTVIFRLLNNSKSINYIPISVWKDILQIVRFDSVTNVNCY